MQKEKLEFFNDSAGIIQKQGQTQTTLRNNDITIIIHNDSEYKTINTELSKWQRLVITDSVRQGSKSVLKLDSDGIKILETIQYDNGRLSPLTKLVILMKNPRNTIDICYCYREKYNGSQKSLNTLTGNREFDYLRCNWQNGMILKSSNCNEYNECNLPFFNVYWLSIFKLFNYTYSDYNLSSIISKNEPLLIIGMHMYNCNEWLNNKIKSLIPESDQLSSLLSNMVFAIKLTKKILCSIRTIKT